MNKCVFLDRDGVINKDYVDYVYTVEKFEILSGVIDALKNLKEAGYYLVITTNQSGIAKGLYTKEDVYKCHQYLQEQCGNLIDEIYYSSCNESYSRSLMRKPDSLMMEKGMAKFNIDPNQSWMIGDKESDMIPARKLGINTVFIQGDYKKSTELDRVSTSLLGASKIILEA